MALMTQSNKYNQQLQQDAGPAAVEEPPLVSLPQSVLTTLMWHVVCVSNPGQVAKMAMVSWDLGPKMPQPFPLTRIRCLRFGGTRPGGTLART